MGVPLLYKVPFIPNVNNRCGVATNAMILGYFEPSLKLNQKELDEFSGYIEDKGSWGIQSALSFDDRGYDTVWIEEFDFMRFSEDALSYLNELFREPEQIAYQLKNSDIPKEQLRAKEFFDRGLQFENRRGTLDDVRKLLKRGYLVKLEVNGNSLGGLEGYCGHSVLVIGCTIEGFVIHNPFIRDMPNQNVSSKLLYRAWKEFGGSFALQAYIIST